MKMFFALLIATVLPLNLAQAGVSAGGGSQESRASVIARNNALIDELSALQKQLSDAKLTRAVGVTLAISGAAVAALGIKFGALKAASPGGDLTGPMNAIINIGAKGAAIIGGATLIGGGYMLAMKQNQINELSDLIAEKTAQLKALSEAIINN